MTIMIIYHHKKFKKQDVFSNFAKNRHYQMSVILSLSNIITFN